MLPITLKRGGLVARPHAWNPWSGLEDFGFGLERFFAWGVPDWYEEPAYPAVNLYSGDDEAVVTAELPGYSAEEIEVSVAGNALTLRGSRASDEASEGEAYRRRERRGNSFSRAVKIPFKVGEKGISAEFKDGILTVKLPRADEDKPKKIKVTT
jgi:HSP20 family protein